MRNKRLACSILAVVVLAAVAVCSHVRSVQAVQRWQRRYPTAVALGAYRPPELVWLLHRDGPSLFVVGAAVMALIVLRQRRKPRSSPAAEAWPFIIFAVALVCAILLHLFALSPWIHCALVPGVSRDSRLSRID